MLKKIMFLLFLILVVVLTAEATIYQQTDSNGNLIFSDEPVSDNAKPLDIVDTVPSTISASKEKTPPPASTDSQTKAYTPYSTFTIASPHNEETLQNPVSIPVQIQLEPRLKDGDRIQIYLDGKAWHAAVSSTRLSLYEVERGAHQLQAKIIDKNNNPQQETNSVTIYVQRATILIKKSGVTNQ